MPKDYLLSGRMLLAQTANCTDKKKRMIIARKFIEGASFNLIKNLKYYNRREKDVEPIIELMDGYRLKIDDTKEIDELRGIEGNL